MLQAIQMTDQPAVHHTQVSSSEDIRPFILSNPMEIAFQLRLLINRHEMLFVYFNQGEQLVLTTILEVDVQKKEFTFDLGSDENINDMLLKSDRAVFVAAPDGIKTQFVCGPFYESRDSKGRVIRCALPPDMVKLQRREYFRVETPIINPLFCQMDHPTPCKLSLHDISLGGFSVTSPKPIQHLEKMSLITDCRIEMPSFGALMFDMEVRNTRTLLNKNGSQYELIGCRYINLSGKMQNLLQRYMIQLERERRSLAG